MTDLDLIMLSAAAAGLTAGRISECRKYIYTHELGKWWSPLMDDGDALRLAVALNIDIQHGEQEGYVSVREKRGARIFAPYKHHATDRGAATRYAIVVAAAKIGKARQAQFIQAKKGISKWKH